MTLTAQDYAVALRLAVDPDAPVDGAIVGVINRLAGVADAYIDLHAAHAPDAVKDEARIRFVGYLYDQPLSSGGQRYANAWLSSGASPLVSPWRIIGTHDLIQQAATQTFLSRNEIDHLVRTIVEPWAQHSTPGLIPNDRLHPEILAALLPLTDLEVGDFLNWNGTAWVRTPAPQGGGTTLPDYSQIETRFLGSRADQLFWEIINHVPSTPGDASGIGHVLTVTGEGDQDYAWRALNVGPAVQAYIDANPIHVTGGVTLAQVDNRIATAIATEEGRRELADQQIRQLISDRSDGIAANRDAVAAANRAITVNTNAIASANLDRQTVIEISPAFEVGQTGASNIDVNIRHPLNAYSDANIMSISVSGSPPVLVTYNPTMLAQSLRAGIPASTIDAQSFQDRLVLGKFIDVEIRLMQGRNGPIQFVRTVDVPVVPAAPAAPVITASAATKIVKTTQTAYDALRAKEAATLYLITS